jgi:hypothetical protein
VGQLRRGWRPAPEDAAFLSQRARVHLVYRWAGRAIQAVMSGQEENPRRRIADAAAWAVTDLGGAAALSRTSRFGLIPRLAIDVVDTIHWGGRGEDCDLAVISGLPLSIEAGIRMGPAALVIPAVSATITGAVRRRRSLPASVGSFRWQVIGVFAGVGMAAYGRSRRRALLARHERELHARLEEAYIGGQNEVAMGADSVVDLLSRTAPLLPEGSDDQVVGRLLASWKQSLAVDTQARTTYLGVALAQWQRRHNAAHSALEADVAFSLPPGDGTILLSGSQSSWLESALDALDLRGRVPVEVVDSDEARQPDTPRHLRVGGMVVSVPRDRIKGLTPIDVGPMGFVVGAMWCLDTTLAGSSGSSPWAVMPVVAGGFGLAAWSNQQVERHGSAAHRRIIVAAFGMAVVHAVGATATMTRTRARNGVQRYPFLSGVEMLGLMLPLYFNEFSTTEQVMIVAGLLGVVGLGLFLMPEPTIWAHLICELLWSGAATLSITGLGDGLSEDVERLNRQLSEVEDAAIVRAFADGRTFVVSLVAEARDGVRRAFEDTRWRMTPSVSAEIERRLEEMRSRLDGLGFGAATAAL